jgi:hypothetical protein
MISLANLSKGEFLVEDITEMESVILNTLDWNMNPPTAACFCGYFVALLPSVVMSSTRQVIYHQSCFFYELSVMDYSLSVSTNQSEVAFAGILNSLMDLSPSLLSEGDKKDFIKDIEGYTSMKHSSARIKMIRKKLMSLYRQSSNNKVHYVKKTGLRQQESCMQNDIIKKSGKAYHVNKEVSNFLSNTSTAHYCTNE